MRLQDFSKRHESCVYCLDFPNGKHYVGKCHDLGRTRTAKGFIWQKAKE